MSSPLVRWVLRITVAAMCLGFAWQVGWQEDAPLLPFLISGQDLGGRGWSEAAGLHTLHIVGGCLAIAGLLSLLRPCGWVLLPIAGYLTLDAILRWWMDLETFPAWVLPSHAARIAAPLALWLADPWQPSGREQLDHPLSQWRTGLVEFLTRWATAITFAVHGLKAIWETLPSDWQAGKFQDLLYASALRIDWHPSEPFVFATLRVIGVVDLVVAALAVFTRWRSVAWYLALWGLVSAGARVTAGGATYWHEIASRAAHVGLPLALAIYWHQRRRSQSTAESPG